MPNNTNDTSAGADRVPDIGDTFTYDGRPYAVRGWLRRAPEGSGGRPTGPDQVPLLYCTRTDAEYVIPAGTTGPIRRVADIQVDGRALWHRAVLASARRMAEDLAGQPAG